MSILRVFRELRNRAKRGAVALPAELLGSWISDPNDREGIDEFGNVSLTFEPDGSLTYTIHTESTDQKMFLTWQVKDGVLITNQPSAPREERTTDSIDAAGTLTLWYPGRPVVYIRGDHN